MFRREYDTTLESIFCSTLEDTNNSIFINYFYNFDFPVTSVFRYTKSKVYWLLYIIQGASRVGDVL